MSTMQIRPCDIFNKKNPMVAGIDVLQGTLNVGDQVRFDGNLIGIVRSIQANHVDVDHVDSPAFACFKVEGPGVNDEMLDMKVILLSSTPFGCLEHESKM